MNTLQEISLCLLSQVLFRLISHTFPQKEYGEDPPSLLSERLLILFILFIEANKHENRFNSKIMTSLVTGKTVKLSPTEN